MTLEQLTARQTEKYGNEMYAGDADTENMFALLKKAATLSPAGQSDFVKLWDYSFATSGQVFIPTKRLASYEYPALTREAAAAGIELV